MVDFGRVKMLFAWVALAVILYTTAMFSNWLVLPGDFFAPVWLPVGFALAAIFQRGRQLWPGGVIGLCGFNLWQGAPLSVTGFTVVVESDEPVRQAVVSHEPDMAGRQVSLDIAPLPGCLGDPSLLFRVWTNLLPNALKFARQSSRAHIEIQAISNSQEIIYSVRDNGTGFDPQYADKRFGVFQRLQIDQQYKGTGVVLAMVERINCKHGGRVWAEGKEDQGATFYFALPI